ncbi:MAG TPA: SH2 domain-containing protein [Gammaproteobacteria bacterium]|nr:SH2 domain-containing protein [Gammaproteobacteria bacterium]
MPDSHLQTILGKSYQPNFKAGQDYLKNQPNGSYVIHPASDPTALMNISIKMHGIEPGTTEIITRSIYNTPENRAKFLVTDPITLLQNIEKTVFEIQEDEFSKGIKNIKYYQDIRNIQQFAGEHFRLNNLESTKYLRRQDTPVGSYVIRPSSSDSTLMTIDIKVNESGKIHCHRIEGTPENRKKFLTDSETFKTNIERILIEDKKDKIKNLAGNHYRLNNLESQEYLKQPNIPVGFYVIHPASDPTALMNISIKMQGIEPGTTEIITRSIYNTPENRAKFSVTDPVTLLQNIKNTVLEIKQDEFSKVIKNVKDYQDTLNIQQFAGEHFQSSDLNSQEYLRKKDTPVGSYVIRRDSSSDSTLMTIDIKVNESGKIQSHDIRDTPENRKAFLDNTLTRQIKIDVIIGQELDKEKEKQQKEERSQLVADYHRVQGMVTKLTEMHAEKNQKKETALNTVRSDFQKYKTLIENPLSENQEIKKAYETLKADVASLKEESEKAKKFYERSNILREAKKADTILNNTDNQPQQRSPSRHR